MITVETKVEDVQFKPMNIGITEYNEFLVIKDCLEGALIGRDFKFLGEAEFNQIRKSLVMLLEQELRQQNKEKKIEI